MLINHSYEFISPCSGACFFVHSSAMYWELSSNQEFTFVPHDLWNNLPVTLLKYGIALARASRASRCTRAALGCKSLAFLRLDVTIIILCTSSVNIFMVIIFGKFSLSPTAIWDYSRFSEFLQRMMLQRSAAAMAAAAAAPPKSRAPWDMDGTFNLI